MLTVEHSVPEDIYLLAETCERRFKRRSVLNT